MAANTAPQIHDAISQEALVAFLQTDLSLSFSMLRTAALTSDLVRYSSLLRKVRAALEVIRSLECQIEDPEPAKVIRHRADELKKDLESFTRAIDERVGLKVT